jgi:hypothetical protein
MMKILAHNVISVSSLMDLSVVHVLITVIFVRTEQLVILVKKLSMLIQLKKYALIVVQIAKSAQIIWFVKNATMDSVLMLVENVSNSQVLVG